MAKTRTLNPEEAALWHLVGKTTKGLKGKEHLKLKQLENILEAQNIITPKPIKPAPKTPPILKQKYPAKPKTEVKSQSAKAAVTITKKPPQKQPQKLPNTKNGFKRVKKLPQIKKIIVKKADIAKLENSFTPSHYKPPVPDIGNERKVRRGQLAIDARIDLHGMTQTTAQNRLREFILNAFAQNKRNLLIITGKGIELEDHKSEAFDMFAAPHRGVLRLKLREWLNRPSVRDHISGISEANAKHGGSGAFYVRLKAKL